MFVPTHIIATVFLFFTFVAIYHVYFMSALCQNRLNTQNTKNPKRSTHKHTSNELCMNWSAVQMNSHGCACGVWMLRVTPKFQPYAYFNFVHFSIPSPVTHPLILTVVAVVFIFVCANWFAKRLNMLHWCRQNVVYTPKQHAIWYSKCQIFVSISSTEISLSRSAHII